MVRNMLQLLQIGGRFYSHPKKREFLSSLSPAEDRVLYLLEEWWGGLIMEDTLSQISKGVLFAYALWEVQMYEGDDGDVGFEQFLMEDEDKNLYQDVKKQVLETKDGVYYNCLAWRQMKEEERGGIVDDPVLTERTAYHRELFHLAKGELLLPNCPDELRNSTRKTAGMLSACQRVANESMTISLRAVVKAEELGIEGRLIELGGQQLKVAIDGRKLQDPRVSRSLRECFWNPGGSIGRCPWLGTVNPDDLEDFRDLPPYYLWNIKEKRTVRVFEENIMPQYAVITHTWGRWRTPGVDISIDNVPWAVPANSRFDVSALPTLLEGAGFAETYVWIDLLCIPQDRSDGAQQAICRMELMRQASIFHNAETAVAWIYDIEKWRPVSAALAYLANNFYNNNTSDDTYLKPLYEMVIETTAECASDPCGLLQGAVGDEKREVIGWFSSLWTLQESLMRPDLLLLNRNWEPLTVWNVTITLDTIASLVMSRHIFFNIDLNAPDLLEVTRGRDKELPVGAKEIYDLFCITGMAQLSNPSQLSALILGGKRVCKHSRSQAIMSVVGATKWFTDNDFRQFSHPESEDEMIFGLYEPGFIKEVFKLVGGSFFLCGSEGVTVSKPDRTTRKDKFRTLSLISGSMLPFSPGSAGRYGNFSGKERGLVDHPSVADWCVGVGRDIVTGFKGGDVLLPTAAILAANCEWEAKPLLYASPNSTGAYAPAETPPPVPKKILPRARPLKGTVQGNPPPVGYDPDKTVQVDGIDLDEWVTKFEDDTFAVCIMSTATEVHGVLLQRPGEGHGPLVKIGNFEMRDEEGIEIPEASDLYWTVI
jgi:hypothetical protein